MTSRADRPFASSPRRRRFLAGLGALAVTPLVPGCGGGGSDAGGGPTIPAGPTVPPAAGVAGPAWWGFGRDARHSAVSAIATQDLNRIAWRTPLDLAPQYHGSALLTHYGSPVITSNNTVVLPVKTGAAGGFRIEARSGVNGGPIWSAPIDYVLPPHNWIPSVNLALTTGNRLYAPGAGGKLLVKADADSPSGALQTMVFFGAAAYAAAPATYDACVFINTPITVDAGGNVFFGFVVTAANPAGLESGLARIGGDGTGSWVSARLVSGDSGVAKVATNSAPALSPDLATLYVAVNANPAAGTVQGGYLLALDSVSLTLQRRMLLIDPGNGTTFARVSDDGTASPTVGPDGHVYFGVLETVFGTHNGRGWLLHFDPALATSFAPGGFGWDDTASIVDASLVPSYTGSSPYLLMVKYNNYRGAGSGDGANKVAVIDPGATQVDPISGRPIMREVLTLLGPTFESGNSGPVVEWCINTAAVDPFTKSVLVNSEDGFLYRWDLASNTASQRIRLTSGIGESYTPTAVGADGAVYAVNNAVLFSIAR